MSAMCVVCGYESYNDIALVGGLTACPHGFHAICGLVAVKRMRAGCSNVACSFDGCNAPVTDPEVPVYSDIEVSAKEEFAYLETNNLVEGLSYEEYLVKLIQDEGYGSEGSAMSYDTAEQVVTLGGFHEDVETIANEALVSIDRLDARNDAITRFYNRRVSESLRRVNLKSRMEIHGLTDLIGRLTVLNQKALTSIDVNRRKALESQQRNDALEADMRRRGINL